jgi:hypothetical protein
MRRLRWLALALMLAVSVATPAAVDAATPSLGLGMSSGSPNVAEIAVHCGPHARYVKGHRARTGHWIKGRCVATRRR